MKLNPLQIGLLAVVVLILLAMAVQKMMAPRAMARPMLATSQAGQGVTEEQIAADFEKIQSQKMLDTHFVQAEPTVPEDYPLKQVGACPYSKPLSRDLPLANVPMCWASEGVAHIKT